MNKIQRRQLPAPHLVWFINLRWISGIAVCGAALIDRWILPWYPNSIPILTVGFGILCYNALLRAALNPDAPQALQQVMVNLLLNSLDAIAEVPSPSLSIETRLGKIGYAIDVTDNGTGIKPEHMNRLFEPFFTTKPVGRGTGLGLSISYSLIQCQGGWIDVQSQLRVGTTMTIHLPASSTAAVKSNPARNESAPA
jgi:signal transduction histidine kinase